LDQYSALFPEFSLWIHRHNQTVMNQQVHFPSNLKRRKDAACDLLLEDPRIQGAEGSGEQKKFKGFAIGDSVDPLPP
jgi:hypothetical protein